jgi:spermidine synthase
MARPPLPERERGTGRAHVPVALLLLFFISGALGLVYEVLWLRRFTVLFGATALATAATLSAFFAGVAAGSAFFGARVHRWRRPLVVFGVLEMGTGVGALLVPFVLDLYRALPEPILSGRSSTGVTITGVKLALAFLAVAFPTFCMGGTLPALGAVVRRDPRGLGLPVSALYAANLAGAALGALAVPYALLPRLGAEMGLRASVVSSILVGVLAIAWGERSAAADAAPARAAPTPRAPVPHALLGLGFLSGAFTLALEALWTRMFSLVHESSVHSFALVSAVFLVGLAGGAAAARGALARGASPLRALGAAWALAGLWITVSPRLFYAATAGLQYATSGAHGAAAARLVGLSAALTLPASIALGLALPLLIASLPEQDAGRALGPILAANTVGAIAGPLVATFVIGPALGLWTGLTALGAAVAVAGLSGRGVSARVTWLGAASFAAGFMLLGPRGLTPVHVGPGEHLVSVREGRYGTTAVLDDGRDRWITVNNAYILGGSAASTEERWQAHLPLLLHPAPRRVAFLGLGTAISAGAALLHPVEVIDAVEIVPDVAEAAREDFRSANGGVLDDPRVHVRADDGRSYMTAPRQRFDVVIGDLLVPWRPAEAALYSREHFTAVRQALDEDGLFCQWLPLYQVSREQLVIVLRTFADVFPQATLWRGSFVPDEPVLALVGHRRGAALDVAGIEERAARLASRVDDDSPFLKDPAGPWLFLVGPLRRGAAWLGPDDGRRNTDARPWLELLAPGDRTGFVGAPLLTFLDGIAAEPIAGTPLERLGAPQREWMRTGAALSRASLARDESGERAVLTLLRTLPPRLQSALGVPAE